MNIENPLISVIVPVYNVSQYLPDCIESIIKQTYENLEIILVDDGSTDSSGEICDKYAQKDPRIKVIHKENGGVASARNNGLKMLTGKYVGFVDSDDTISADMYEKLYLSLKETDSDISVCDCYYCSSPGNHKDPNEDTETFLTFSREEALMEMYAGKYISAFVWNKLFKAEIIRDLRFDTDIHVGEDLLFSSQAIIKSKKICNRSGRYYNYLQRETSAMHRPPDYKFITNYHAHFKILECLKDNGLGHLSKYVDFMIILISIRLVRKVYLSGSIQKEYCVFAKNNLKKHLNKESFLLLSTSAKCKALLIVISWRLYFLSLKILKR